ncbi:hypothetical protein [Stenotrophomonas nitritireducens]|nr:hypothetical protein [Stenotrophomonas nitritireducens]AMJ55484.1 hypothetical protein AXG53_01660 [Stenotrophomonas sp. KCTC 12332]
MDYEKLRDHFDVLAQQVVQDATSLGEHERKQKLLEMHQLVDRIVQVVPDHDQQAGILCKLEDLVYRANSAINAAEQLENLRKRSALAYGWPLHTD